MAKRGNNKYRRSSKRRITPRRRLPTLSQAIRSTSKLVTSRVKRSFSLYPRQWAENSGSSWLDQLLKYGALAIKVFSTLIKVEEGVGSTWAITGAVQVILLGAEDLAFSSPMKMQQVIDASYDADVAGTVVHMAPVVNYKWGKILDLNVTLSVGAVAATRAGRYSAALVPLTEEEAILYASKSSQIDVPRFEELAYLPGVKTREYGKPIHLRWRPSSSQFGNRLVDIGQQTKPPTDGDVTGGKPVVALYIGYQDMASSKPDPDALYSPEEALVNVDLSSRIGVQEWGSTWIRRSPICADAKIVGCEIGNMRFSVPATSFRKTPNGLHLPWDRMSEAVRRLAICQSKSVHPIALFGVDPSFEGITRGLLTAGTSFKQEETEDA